MREQDIENVIRRDRLRCGVSQGILGRRISAVGVTGTVFESRVNPNRRKSTHTVKLR